MSILGNVEKGLRFAVSETASVTKEFLEITKLNSSISARQREIELAYSAIGRMLFEREAADPSSPAASLCKKILDNQTSVAEMTARIEHVKAEGKETRRGYAEDVRKKDEPAEDVAEAEEAEAPFEPAPAADAAVDEAVRIVEAAGTAPENAEDTGLANPETPAEETKPEDPAQPESL